MRIYLIGFMGVGKSKKGRKLALRLGFQYIDMDEWIEEKEKMTIPEIFKSKGESYFRQVEYEAVKFLSKVESAVISTGGGSPCYFDAIELMNASGITIYLKGSPAFLLKRLKESKKKRPLIEALSSEELLNFITTKLDERAPFYEKAKFQIDALNCKAKDLVALIKSIQV